MEFVSFLVVDQFHEKQTSVALFTAKAKYITVGSYVTQILWIKQELEDYGMRYSQIPIYCDNTSAINLSKNPVMHYQTKHIEIRHHFIRDHMLNGDIKLIFVPTNMQLANIFTKPLSEDHFYKIRTELGVIDLDA